MWICVILTLDRFTLVSISLCFLTLCIGRVPSFLLRVFLMYRLTRYAEQKHKNALSHVRIPKPIKDISLVTIHLTGILFIYLFIYCRRYSIYNRQRLRYMYINKILIRKIKTLTLFYCKTHISETIVSKIAYIEKIESAAIIIIFFTN